MDRLAHLVLDEVDILAQKFLSEVCYCNTLPAFSLSSLVFMKRFLLSALCIKSESPAQCKTEFSFCLMCLLIFCSMALHASYNSTVVTCTPMKMSV
jgi:hypothetical protein